MPPQADKALNRLLTLPRRVHLAIDRPEVDVDKLVQVLIMLGRDMLEQHYP